MWWYAKKWERTQMVGLWEMFAVKLKNWFCKNQYKKNLLIKGNMYNTVSKFFKLVNFAKAKRFS